MVQAKAIRQRRPFVGIAVGNPPVGLLTFLFIIFFATLAIYQLRSPKPVPASAPLTEFSSARAMKHLGIIASEPHPVGSPAQTKVRDYIKGQITALGLAPEVQTTTSVMQTDGVPFLAATVENVFTRLKGTGGGKAVLLSAHYDSVGVSPGANDNGTGVAAVLETLRAVKEGPQFKNDIIILFTDGEELGLLGATAFVDEHPWAKDVSVALNYDARGSRGPTIMFETSDGNRWLIDEFAKAAPHPFANSLSGEIYKMIPYGSDMTAYKQAGYQGLNFAYIDSSNHYHNRIDDLQNTDERNLQHFGSYALALVRHFGNVDLQDRGQEDAVYFDVFGWGLIHYSARLTPVLAGILALSFVGVVVLGFRKKRLKVSGILLGLFATLLSLITAPIVVTVIWWMIRQQNINYRTFPQGDVYNSKIYLVAFTALTIGIFSTIFLLFRKRAGADSLAVGSYFCVLVLAVLTSLSVRGASYLFTWPLLFGLAGLAFTFARKDGESLSQKQVAALWLSSVPALILFTPLVYLVFVAMTLALSAATIIILGLLLALLVPHLNLMTASRKWLLPVGSWVVFAVFVIVGSLTSNFDAQHPKPNSIFYVMNADSQKAIWVSVDGRPDEWTEQFLSKNVRNDSIAEYLDTPYPNFLQNEAPRLPLTGPDIQVVEDRVADGVRYLKLRITSPRRAPILLVTVRAGGQTIAATINGKPSGRLQDQWAFDYSGLPPEGIELGMQVMSTQPIKIRAADQTYGLPEIQGMTFTPRPDSMMPVNFRNSDCTLVTKSFLF